ncbi:hypothetical protein HQ520_12785, partial [bacterium]|nr:hypothetical protein [bacterium]
MFAGFSETDITPSLGMEQPGNYLKAYIDRIHDPLKVRAGVFDDGRKAVALVGVDTCVIPRRTVVEARRQIRERCGIPDHHVLIGASHTHAGGPLFGFFED